MNNNYQHILVDAKREYTQQLVDMLTYRIYEGIKSIYRDSVNLTNQKYSNQYLKEFQSLLSTIPKWSEKTIKKETERILKKSDCEWLEDLITAVFITHAKVLASIKSSNNDKTIDLQVPTCQYFIHKTYIHVARQFWKMPFLLDHRLNHIDTQRNLSKSLEIISKSIEETIRKQLPVKNILKEYLGVDYINKEKDLDNEDISVNLSETGKDNLKKLVEKEINTTNITKSENLDDNYSNFSISNTVSNFDIISKESNILQLKPNGGSDKENSEYINRENDGSKNNQNILDNLSQITLEKSINDNTSQVTIEAKNSDKDLEDQINEQINNEVQFNRELASQRENQSNTDIASQRENQSNNDLASQRENQSNNDLASQRENQSNNDIASQRENQSNKDLASQRENQSNKALSSQRENQSNKALSSQRENQSNTDLGSQRENQSNTDLDSQRENQSNKDLASQRENQANTVLASQRENQSNIENVKLDINSNLEQVQSEYELNSLALENDKSETRSNFNFFTDAINY